MFNDKSVACVELVEKAAFQFLLEVTISSPLLWPAALHVLSLGIRWLQGLHSSPMSVTQLSLSCLSEPVEVTSRCASGSLN
jgi:hypothetical protein